MGLFLQTLPFSELAQGAVSEVLKPYSGIIIGVLSVILLTILILYIYLSIAYSKIGKKAGLNSYNVAWMPLGIIAIIFEVSKMHWWPFLVFTLGYIFGYFLMVLGVFGVGSVISILGIVVLVIAAIVHGIMSIVWHWKTYEAVGKPGWWILAPILAVIAGYLMVFLNAPLVSFILIIFGFLTHLVLVGLAAWGRK